LFDDPLLVAVARTHWLASARGVTPDVVADEAWIVGSSDRSEGLLGAWDSATWAPRIPFTAKDWNAKIGLVAAGLGITVVPALSAPSFGDRIRLVRINDDRAARAVLLARPASATTTEPSHQLATILRDQALAWHNDLRSA
jgi:DNA-binding transcriptional LysR family regulator